MSSNNIRDKGSSSNTVAVEIYTLSPERTLDHGFKQPKYTHTYKLLLCVYREEHNMDSYVYMYTFNTHIMLTKICMAMVQFVNV